MKVCPLDEVLGYSNLFVVERFTGKHRVSLEDGEEIFRETLKLLWLMDTHKKEPIAAPRRIIVYRPMAVIDEMWHEFILFSRAYTAFCRRFFGNYLHHKPTTSADRVRERDREDLRREVEAQCRYIREKLGGETLARWFKDFPARYPGFTP